MAFLLKTATDGPLFTPENPPGIQNGTKLDVFPLFAGLEQEQV
jgi:hypothetical protein